MSDIYARDTYKHGEHIDIGVKNSIVQELGQQPLALARGGKVYFVQYLVDRKFGTFGNIDSDPASNWSASTYIPLSLNSCSRDHQDWPVDPRRRLEWFGFAEAGGGRNGGCSSPRSNKWSCGYGGGRGWSRNLDRCIQS